MNIHELPVVFALLAVIAFAALAARRWRVPHSILLVLLGLGLSFLPAMPPVALNPELVLLLFLPPLLYRAGVNMSWLGFKANLRPILLLAVGCVLFTASMVAALCHYLFGFPWALGFVLGAVISPPDAIAPMAIARHFAIPGRVLTILEGESLVNDATALTLFSFAIAAVAMPESFSLTAAVGSFAAIVTGELLWGVAVGWLGLSLRRWARDPRVEIVFALLTPFAAFWVPEHLGGSGVIAAVAAGLYVSWNGPAVITPATRLQGFFVWDLFTYLIEGAIFLLTGLQAQQIAESLSSGDWQRLALTALVVCAAIILVRFIWVYVATYLPRLLSRKLCERDPPPPRAEVFFVAFTGIRGVVSLAAVLSVPLMADGAPFPERGLLVLVTFAVILVTLVGQGLSLPFVIEKLGLGEAGRHEAALLKQQEIAARIRGIDAAMARLDALEGAALAPDTVAALKRRAQDRRMYFVAACQDLELGSAALSSAALQLRFLEAERASIAALHREGGISDEARRRIERELDLEDSRIRHSAESGSGRVL